MRSQHLNLLSGTVHFCTFWQFHELLFWKSVSTFASRRITFSIKSEEETDETCLMRFFGKLDNMLGKRSSQLILTRKKDNKKQPQHTCGPDAIKIKITAIEHDIISGPELISIGTVEISSQKEGSMCSEKADLYLTDLIFQDVLRRLYKV